MCTFCNHLQAQLAKMQSHHTGFGSICICILTNVVLKLHMCRWQQCSILQGMQIIWGGRRKNLNRPSGTPDSVLLVVAGSTRQLHPGQPLGQHPGDKLHAPAVCTRLLWPPVLHVHQGGSRTLRQNQHMVMPAVQEPCCHCDCLCCQQPAGAGVSVLQHPLDAEGQ